MSTDMQRAAEGRSRVLSTHQSLVPVASCLLSPGLTFVSSARPLGPSYNPGHPMLQIVTTNNNGELETSLK